jgi:hypothetical protein
MRRRVAPPLILLGLCLAAPSTGAADRAPEEPDGYRIDDYRAATPATVAGRAALDTAAAHRLWQSHAAAFIDVPRRPEGVPAGAIWGAAAAPRHSRRHLASRRRPRRADAASRSVVPREPRAGERGQPQGDIGVLLRRRLLDELERDETRDRLGLRSRALVCRRQRRMGGGGVPPRRGDLVARSARVASGFHGVASFAGSAAASGRPDCRARA